MNPLWSCMDSSVPLIHHDPDRSGTDSDPDHLKETHPPLAQKYCFNGIQFLQ